MPRSRLVLTGLFLLAGCSRTPHEPASEPVATKPASASSSEKVAESTVPPPNLEMTPIPAATAPPAEPPPLVEIEKPGEVSKILEDASRIAEEGKLDEAIKRVDDAVKVEPENRQALLLLASLQQGRAQELERPQSNALYIKSAEGMRRLRAAHKDLNPAETRIFEAALYNEVCTYATENKPEKALDTLAEAVAAGFSQLGLLDQDDELESIRKQPKFQELRNQVFERAKTQAKDRARTLLASGMSFMFDFKLPDLNDKPVELASLKGKVVIVDIWGTWCPPCRGEIPHFIALSKKYHDKGLEIVGLNYEQAPPEEVKSTIQKFAEENKITYPCLIGDDKTREQVPNFEGFPTTLFIDRSGKVRAQLVGYEPGQELLMEELVTKLLNEEEEN